MSEVDEETDMFFGKQCMLCINSLSQPQQEELGGNLVH